MDFSILLAGLTAIVLFLFGLEGFSREIEKITGAHFRKSLSKATTIPIIGVAIGALVTAVIQSSSATSVITVSLVNAGVLSFKNSVGIIFGSNVGTTITAQLIAFKLTKFAPLIILFGFVLSLIKTRYSIFSKAIFYFGFVFFSLNLISDSLSPLRDNESLIHLLTQPQHPIYGILFGCLFTALIQSSSVTTGLAIIFTQQGLLGLENAVPLIMGANIGTTATALLAMVNMDIAAKKTAMSHFFFNVGGVLLFLPVLLIFGHKLSEVTIDPAIALANIHLIFNLVATLFFLLIINPFVRFVDKLLGEGKMDFERISLPVYDEEKPFSIEKYELEEKSKELFAFVQENYSAVSLSLESNYKLISETAAKRIEYTDFLRQEYVAFFARLSTKVHGSQDSKDLMRLINRFDYILKIEEAIIDIHRAKKGITQHYIDLQTDILLLIRNLSTATMSYFEAIHRSLEGDQVDLKAAAKEMQSHISKAYKQLLRAIANPGRKDAGALTGLVTYTQALKDEMTLLAKVKPLARERPMDIIEQADVKTEETDAKQADAAGEEPESATVS